MSTSVILYLARHGETDWNRAGRWQGQTDIPLNESGRAQARALARSLAELGVTEVHASDLLRARQTAELCAQALGAPLRGLHGGLRERNFGVLEGMTREDMAARLPALWADYQAGRRIVPEGAEPHAHVVARMHAAIRSIAAPLAGTDGQALVISHGGAIRMWLSARTGREFPPLPNVALFRVALREETVEHAELLPGISSGHAGQDSP